MTSYYELTEWPAFLSAIRAAPDDDLPRLVAADFIEENGDAERAGLVRKMCEKHTRHVEFGSREVGGGMWIWDSLKRSMPTWFKWKAVSRRVARVALESQHTTAWRSVGVRLHRGFVSRASAPLSVLHGGECRNCVGVGNNSELVGYDAGPCPHCQGAGRTHGVLGELLRREPLTAAGIEVTQVTPVGVVPNEYLRSGTGPDRNWAWGLSVSTQYDCYMIPRDVWDLMPPTKLAEPRGRYKVFPTADAARLALGEALYRLHGPKSEVTT